MSSCRYSFLYGKALKIKKNRRYALDKNPQKKASCLKVYVTTPRKPNSAIRKIAKVSLSNKNQTIGHIHGIGHTLQKYSTVLVRGCRVRDTPGIKYRFIRGKFDFKSVLRRYQGRSKYGVKRRT